MPLIKVLHVCSCSSEDPNQPADNLLSLESYKKWSCAAAGEKKVIVVMQFEKSSQIHALDIGNNGSAFVEILVGRSTTPDNFEVLLGMSTFMTPPESKQWTHINRVRMFGKDKFSKEVAAQNWDRVKVVCTQPYNKNEKYGLSFIKLHSPPEKSDTADVQASSTPPKIGAFSLKEEAKTLASGSLFFRRKMSPPAGSEPSPNAAAQARMATSAALKAQSLASQSQTDQLDQGKAVQTENEASGRKKKTTPMDYKELLPAKKPKVSADETRAPVPLSKILDGVIFVLSGFKNPFRGQLREKGVEMGGVYQADWDSTCTHLICAFPNTPKFNQVRGTAGLVVKKEWVLDCHAKKKRLPAKKYRLSSGIGDTSSSEDERYDSREAAIFKKKVAEVSVEDVAKSPDKGVDMKDKGDNQTLVKNEEGVSDKEEEDPYEISTDEEPMGEDEVVKSKSLTTPTLEDRWSSECDTEDEIEKVRQSQREKEAKENPGPQDSQPKDTDKDTSSGDPSSDHVPRSLLDLPDFFSKCTMFLYGDFSVADRRMLTRYIVAYGGHIVEYMSSEVTHVLTLEDWDDNFDQALIDNSTLAFVRPKWVFACHQKQKCVPYQSYAVALR